MFDVKQTYPGAMASGGMTPGGKGRVSVLASLIVKSNVRSVGVGLRKFSYKAQVISKLQDFKNKTCFAK